MVDQRQEGKWFAFENLMLSIALVKLIQVGVLDGFELGLELFKVVLDVASL